MYCRLDTCKDPNANKQLVHDNFDELYNEVLENGMISEETFDRLGFPEDEHEDGSICRKDGVSIRQEHRQRAKILSHKHQKELRKNALNAAAEKEAAAWTLEQAAISSIQTKNAACEKILFQEMKMPTTTGRRQLTNATQEQFNKPKKDLLQAFVHCRKWTGGSTEKGWKWPNKNKGSKN